MADHSRGSIVFTIRVAAVVAVLLPLLRVRLLFVRREPAAHQLVKRYTQRALRAIGCRVELSHLDRVPSGESLMFVSNHVSIADAAVLLAVLPFDVGFVANHIFAQYPLLGAAIRGASANIVNRGNWRSRGDSGQAMVDALASGRSLLVFPEGTTADGDAMLPFRNGAFRAAARTGCRVVPIVLRGTREMMPAGRTLLADVPIQIEILEPIRPTDATREGMAALRDAAAAAIRARLAVPIS